MKLQYQVLGKYIQGKVVSPEDGNILNSLASVGLVHLGSHVEFDDESGLIRILPTAKATTLGRKVYNMMRPNLLERILFRE